MSVREAKGRYTAIITLIGLLLFGLYHSTPKIKEPTNFCPRIAPLSPSFDTSLSKIYNDKAWQAKVIEKLSKAVQIPTEVFDDSIDPSISLDGWQTFIQFHQYLRTAFPGVHSSLTLEKINKIGLLYTWEGSNPRLKPLLLMAHQDVVPVNTATQDQWTHGAFSGYYDGHRIWGRGSSDTKQLLISELESVELLLKDGFKPQRTILIAFGCDEEATGRFGAREIAETIHKRYGNNSLYAILDEGGGLEQVDDDLFIAQVVTAEKGFLDLTIELFTPGGHSSVPPKHTGIGIASELIKLIESKEYGVALHEDGPVLKSLQCRAEHQKSMDEYLAAIILRASEEQRAKGLLEKYMYDTPELRYLIGTSQAVDVIRGGIKSNALPESVSFLVNHRISLDSSTTDVVDHVMGSVMEIANKYELGIGEGQNGYFTITPGIDRLEPAPISPDSGKVWDQLAGTIVHNMENGLFKSQVFDFSGKVVVSPALSTGNTDTRWFWNLTKNIFRFGCSIERPDQNIHTVDEFTYADELISSVGFLYQYIGNVQE